MTPFLIASALSIWDFEVEERKIFERRIEQRHKERLKLYYEDSAEMSLNFSSFSCPFCRNRDGGLELEELLRRENFYKERAVFESRGHCFGISLLFVRHLLTQNLVSPCSSILNHFSEMPNLKELAHQLQVNQPGFYAENGSGKWVLSDREAAKKCFSLLTQAPVHDYVFVPKSQLPAAKFDKAVLFRLFHESQILVFSSIDEEEKNPHCIVVHTGKKLLFDPNEGLYRFTNLETMAALLELQLTKRRVAFIVSF
jgi:hypothetical protein